VNFPEISETKKCSEEATRQHPYCQVAPQRKALANHTTCGYATRRTRKYKSKENMKKSTTAHRWREINTMRDEIEDGNIPEGVKK